MIGMMTALLGGNDPLIITRTDYSNTVRLRLHNNIAAGDRLTIAITLRSTGGSITVPAPTGWTRIIEGGSGGASTTRVAILYRFADGTESGTNVSFAMGGVVCSAAAIIDRTPAALSPGTPTGTSLSGASSTTVDPPAHNSGSATSKRWLAGFGSNGAAQPTTWPYADGRNHVTYDVSDNSRVMWCETTSSSATVDPGTFTMGTATNSLAFTVALP